MDACEATNTVMSRIQTLDPDNASKIMGYILLQDQGDQEMIRLAFSPDAILLSYINRAKASFAHFPPRILIPTNNGAGFRLNRPADGSGSPGSCVYFAGGGGSGEYRLSDPANSLGFRYGEDVSPFHKRSCSEGGCGLWGPCMNLERGFSCNGDLDELMGMKALQQQKRVWAVRPHYPFSYNRGDVSPESPDSVARQIYLTFPSDSTFKEEDVSDYFGVFGPVQDVRIPYQQKRMFGFVTFVYPETVKRILAKGNPHFVCDSRVLVKPYKEKGKCKEKKHSPRCLSPSRVDVHSDTRFGPRMMFSPRGMMLRRKFKQEAETQRAIEFEGQRMMNLQLMDEKYHKYHHLHSLPVDINQENSEEFDVGQNSTVEVGEKKIPEVIDDESKLIHEGCVSSGQEAIES